MRDFLFVMLVSAVYNVVDYNYYLTETLSGMLKGLIVEWMSALQLLVTHT